MLSRVLLVVFRIVGAVLVCVSLASARPFAGRTSVDLGAGWRHHPPSTENLIMVNDRPLASATDGLVGHVGISHLADENLAITMSYNLHDWETYPRVDAYGFAYEETSIIHSFTLGFKLYAPRSHAGLAARPYLSVEAGSLLGSTGRSVEDDCDCDESIDLHSKVVPMARLGVGLEFPLGPNVTFGLDGRYNFVDRFDEPIGGRYDYSGPELGFSFSIRLGSGRR